MKKILKSISHLIFYIGMTPVLLVTLILLGILDILSIPFIFMINLTGSDDEYFHLSKKVFNI